MDNNLLLLIIIYYPEKEDWNAYTERFEQFILANGVEGEKKVVATFLTTVGSPGGGGGLRYEMDGDARRLA